MPSPGVAYDTPGVKTRALRSLDHERRSCSLLAAAACHAGFFESDGAAVAGPDLPFTHGRTSQFDALHGRLSAGCQPAEAVASGCLVRKPGRPIHTVWLPHLYLTQAIEPCVRIRNSDSRDELCAVDVAPSSNQRKLEHARKPGRREISHFDAQ